MKYFFSTILVLFFCNLLQGQVLYKDDFFKATVIFPDSTFSCSFEDVETPIGKLSVKKCAAIQIVNNQKLRYLYQVIAYPLGVVHHDSLELVQNLFDDTIDESTKAVIGELVYSSELDLEDYPGIIWRISYDKRKGVIKSRAVVRDHLFINLKVDYPNSLSVVPEIDVFLNSLKLTN
jgi:hypothetical protein